MAGLGVLRVPSPARPVRLQVGKHARLESETLAKALGFVDDIDADDRAFQVRAGGGRPRGAARGFQGCVPGM